MNIPIPGGPPPPKRRRGEVAQAKPAPPASGVQRPARAAAPSQQELGGQAGGSGHPARGIAPPAVPAPLALLRRGDMPPVYQYTRGCKNRLLQLAACGDSRQQAIDRTRLEAFAPSSRTPRQQRENLWETVLAKAGVVDPYALTPDFVFMAAGLFRAAGYRSAIEYVNQAVNTARERGQPPGDDVLRAVYMARNACKRGLGPPKRTAPLPLAALGTLSDDQDAWVPEGPLHPLRALVAGSWWLTREIELGNAACGDITVIDDNTVEWNLPVSKSDTRALGARRSHRCACAASSGSGVFPRLLCPVCTLKAQLLFRAGAPPEAPLFPDASGGFVSKKAMIATIEAAATNVQLPLVSQTGAPRWGGHALRRGGAQYLATRGVDTSASSAWRAIPPRPSSRTSRMLMRPHSLILPRRQSCRGACAKLSPNLPPSCRPQGRRRPDPPSLAIEPATCPRANYVVSDRGAGKMHIVDPDHPDTTACRWRFAAQPSALLTDDPATSPPCTRCVGASLRRPSLPRLLPADAASSSSDSDISSD